MKGKNLWILSILIGSVSVFVLILTHLTSIKITYLISIAVIVGIITIRLLDKLPHDKTNSILESKAANSKIRKYRNIMLSKYKSYRKKDRYLIRIIRKSGSILTIWFDTSEEADSIIDWSMEDGDDTKTFTLSFDKIAKLNRNDIEVIECNIYSFFERTVIVPILSFLRQETTFKISFSKMFAMFSICLGLVSITDVHLLSKAFTIGINKDTIDMIINSTYNLFILMISLTIIILSIPSLLRCKESIGKYYSDILKPKNSFTVGYSLSILLVTPFILKYLGIPLIEYATLIAQELGYIIL